jgi:hypothetical protein
LGLPTTGRFHCVPLSPDPSHPTPIEHVLAPRITGHGVDNETSNETDEPEEEPQHIPDVIGPPDDPDAPEVEF